MKALNKKNQKFIDIFLEYIDLIQYEKDEHIEYRLRTMNYVIKIISKLKNPITSGKDLLIYRGIGQKTANRIDEIINTDELRDSKILKQKYKKQIKKNKIINELTEVIGIGRVVANDLIDKYKIKSLKNLKDMVKNEVITVNDKIKIGLKYAGKFQGSIPRKEISEIGDLLNKVAKKHDLNMIICGSYRRGLPTSNDIDVLLYRENLTQLEDTSFLKDYVQSLKRKHLIKDDIAGDNIKTKYMGFCKWKDNPYRRIDIRLVPYDSLYTAILYFTGSYELNRIMRSQAKKLGYKLNEYGMYKDNKKIPISSEEEVFKILHLEYLPPEERNII